MDELMINLLLWQPHTVAQPNTTHFEYDYTNTLEMQLVVAGSSSGSSSAARILTALAAIS
jgi:hypothetical protein